MPLAVDNRDHKRVRQTVTHQRRNRRTQTRFIVINAFTLAHEAEEFFLLLKKYLQRILNR